MFNDRYGLTQAVLDGRKTQTRRIVSQSIIDKYSLMEDFTIIDDARYNVGEVVAVAQSYKDCTEECIRKTGLEVTVKPHLEKEPGYKNKMFVRADLMPHRICITDVRVERLNDISEDDCFKEGIYASNSHEIGYGIPWVYGFDKCKDVYFTPREAYAALIDKISGKGSFKSNPYVFVYEFELLK